MKKNESRKTRSITIKIAPEELDSLHQAFKTTTLRIFSEYIRALLRRKPVVMRYRNGSLDEFLPIAIGMKNELQAIRKNHDLAVQTLQTHPKTPDIQQAIDFLLCEELALMQTMESIRVTLINIYEKCSH